eukprot:5024111-Pyramimonas_sp.AAC.1
MAQERPKRGPKGSPDGPKSAQERPKRASRDAATSALFTDALHDRPKRPSRAPIPTGRQELSLIHI